MPDSINDVHPFRALHYDPRTVTDIGLCLSQPYDVISADQQDGYYRQHPHNVIRLILGKQKPEDGAQDNRYSRARATLDQWLAEGILRHAARPSFWVYEQRFTLPQLGSRTLTGFIGLVRLRDYAEQAILPHEKVMHRVVDDRLQLMRSTNLQMEYIWSVYQDPERAIDRLLTETEAQQPVVQHHESHHGVDHGVDHRLWRLDDEQRCATIAGLMREQTIFIADGHHRYQTMLQFRDEMRRRYPDAGPDAPWEFILMYLVNSEHEGLAVLPTHRLLRGLPAERLEALGTALGEHFRIEHYRFDGDGDVDGDAGGSGDSDGRAAAQRRWLNDLRDVAPGRHKIGFYLRNSATLAVATLADVDRYEQQLDADASSRWKRLDVTILNTLVLEQMLGLSEEQLDGQSTVRYTGNIDEALAAVDAGAAQVAFILNPTALEDVLAVARAGERMPRKSTHFYPKPVSGLVFYPMDLPGQPPATPP